jgi:hypothetical protein
MIEVRSGDLLFARDDFQLDEQTFTKILRSMKSEHRTASTARAQSDAPTERRVALPARRPRPALRC